MLKVVIADDEKKICLLIQKIIDWESLGYEVTAVANSGTEAYDLIKKYNPDVVITDIRMPGFDGVELIRHIKEQGHHTEFIIISGYKHFEYAHDALKLGVEHYLLKPIDKDELTDSLIKIKENFEKINIKQSEQKNIEQRLQMNKEKIREHFISSIINNEESFSNVDLSSINSQLQIDFRKGIFQSLFIKIDAKHENTASISKILKMVKDKSEEFLRQQNFEYISRAANSGLIVILNYHENTSTKIIQVYRSLFDEIQKTISKFEDYLLTIGIGVPVTEIKYTAFSIKTAVDAIKCRIDLGTSKLIVYPDLTYNPITFDNITNSGIIRKLENAIETLDKNFFSNAIDSIINDIHNIKNYSPIMIFAALEQANEHIKTVYTKMGGEPEEINNLYRSLCSVLDIQLTEKTLIHHFKKTVEVRIDKYYENRANQNKLNIRSAKKYISEHYMEQITLEEVAQAIHLNPSYLSASFKKELGINFSDYIIDCRIETAKELLKTTNDSIITISEKIGYADAKYFSKLFNKTVGLKPSTYRKLYS